MSDDNAKRIVVQRRLPPATERAAIRLAVCNKVMPLELKNATHVVSTCAEVISDDGEAVEMLTGLSDDLIETMNRTRTYAYTAMLRVEERKKTGRMPPPLPPINKFVEETTEKLFTSIDCIAPEGQEKGEEDGEQEQLLATLKALINLLEGGKE